MARGVCMRWTAECGLRPRAGFALMCLGGAPVIAFGLQPPPARNPTQVRVLVDDAEHRVDLAQDGAGGMWVSPLRDETLIEALRTGQTAQFYIEERLRATVPLAGLGLVIRDALGRCYEPRATATEAISELATSSTDGNLMARVPFRLEYYVSEGEGCDNPSWVLKFEPDRYLQINSDGTEEYRLKAVSGPLEDGAYFLEWSTAAWGPIDQACLEDETNPTGIGVRPIGGGMLEIAMQDFFNVVPCDEAQIPTRFRR